MHFVISTTEYQTTLIYCLTVVEQQSQESAIKPAQMITEDRPDGHWALIKVLSMLEERTIWGYLLHFSPSWDEILEHVLTLRRNEPDTELFLFRGNIKLVSFQDPFQPQEEELDSLEQLLEDMGKYE